MTIIKKTSSNKHWWWCGEKRTLLHCWWDCQLVQPLQKTMEVPHEIKNRDTIWSSWRRQWHPTPVLLPGKSHGWRSLVGCSPWGCEESDMTEWLHFHFSLSCLGEGNGNPLQCSCLENPRDGGAWWAAVYGVTQSRTRLKRLSSSSIWSSNPSSVYISKGTETRVSKRHLHSHVPCSIILNSQEAKAT